MCLNIINIIPLRLFHVVHNRNLTCVNSNRHGAFGGVVVVLGGFLFLLVLQVKIKSEQPRENV